MSFSNLPLDNFTILLGLDEILNNLSEASIVVLSFVRKESMQEIRTEKGSCLAAILVTEGTTKPLTCFLIRLITFTIFFTPKLHHNIYAKFSVKTAVRRYLSQTILFIFNGTVKYRTSG